MLYFSMTKWHWNRKKIYLESFYFIWKYFIHKCKWSKKQSKTKQTNKKQGYKSLKSAWITMLKRYKDWKIESLQKLWTFITLWIFLYIFSPVLRYYYTPLFLSCFCLFCLYVVTKLDVIASLLDFCTTVSFSTSICSSLFC